MATTTRQWCKSVGTFVVIVSVSVSVALVPSTSQATPADDTQAAIESINHSRAAAGVCPLTIDPAIQQRAQNWTAHMSAASLLSHGALSPEPGELRAENVGRARDVGAVHELFMLSAPHHRNVVDSRFDRIGVGVVEAGDRTWVTYRFAGARDASRVCR